jgi:peptidoglycan/xylan/chitin deacetylase (PgdA/CDA1 family)
MKIPAKIPRIVKWVYPNVTWQIPNNENALYLTFDDGPTPEITNWVLAELAKYNAKGTFFLIGNNVAQHPEIVANIREAGHSIGNHCYNHEKGWTTSRENYFASVEKTNVLLNTKLFRPPYGRIKRSQIAVLKDQYKIIMWDVLSHDYDKNFSPQECAANVINNSKAGSIIVFHDSVKAWPNLKVALPIVLKQLSSRGFVFKAL